MKSDFLKNIVGKINSNLETTNTTNISNITIDNILSRQSEIIDCFYQSVTTYEAQLLTFKVDNEKQYSESCESIIQDFRVKEQILKNRIDDIRVNSRTTNALYNQEYTADFFEITKPVSALHESINQLVYQDSLSIKLDLEAVDEELKRARQKYQTEADYISILQQNQNQKETSSYSYKKNRLVNQVNDGNALHAEEMKLFSLQTTDFENTNDFEQKRIRKDQLNNARELNQQVSNIYAIFQLEHEKSEHLLDEQLKPLYSKQKDLANINRLKLEEITVTHKNHNQIITKKLLKINEDYEFDLGLLEHNFQNVSPTESIGNQKSLIKKNRSKKVFLKKSFDNQRNSVHREKERFDQQIRFETETLSTNYRTEVLLVEKQIFFRKETHEIERAIINSRLALALLPLEQKINEHNAFITLEAERLQNRFEILLKEIDSKEKVTQHRSQVALLNLEHEQQILDESLVHVLKKHRATKQLDIQKEALKRNFSKKYHDFKVDIFTLQNKLKRTSYNWDLQRLTANQNYERRKLRLNHGYRIEELEQSNAILIAKTKNELALLREDTSLNLYKKRIDYFMSENNFSISFTKTNLNDVFARLQTLLEIYQPLINIAKVVDTPQNDDLLIQLIDYINAHYQRYGQSFIHFSESTLLDHNLETWRIKYLFLESELKNIHLNSLEQLNKAQEEFKHNLELLDKNLEKVEEDIVKTRVNIVLYQERRAAGEFSTIDENLEFLNLSKSAELTVSRLNLVKRDLIKDRQDIIGNIITVNRRIKVSNRYANRLSKDLSSLKKSEKNQIVTSNKTFTSRFRNIFYMFEKTNESFDKTISATSLSQIDLIAQFSKDLILFKDTLVNKHLTILNNFFKIHQHYEKDYQERLARYIYLATNSSETYNQYYINIQNNFKLLIDNSKKRLQTTINQTTQSKTELLELVETSYQNEVAKINQKLSSNQQQIDSLNDTIDIELGLLLNNQDDSYYQMELQFDNAKVKIDQAFNHKANANKQEISRINNDYIAEKQMNIDREKLIDHRYHNSSIKIIYEIKSTHKKHNDTLRELETSQQKLHKRFAIETDEIIYKNAELIGKINQQYKKKV